MYKITEEYKQYIENKTSLVPKCKIVVDGIEYTGKVIKTVPKISHSAEKMIGSFPIRTCSFDIYDMDNSLNFENKEIYVFKGLLVNNEIEYIPQGVFIAEADKITTDITKRTISFNNIQDRTIKFDTKYETKLDWSINHTGLEIIEEICKELEIPLETKEFNYINELIENNFHETSKTIKTSMFDVIKNLYDKEKIYLPYLEVLENLKLNGLKVYEDNTWKDIKEDKVIYLNYYLNNIKTYKYSYKCQGDDNKFLYLEILKAYSKNIKNKLLITNEIKVINNDCNLTNTEINKIFKDNLTTNLKEFTNKQIEIKNIIRGFYEN